MFYDKKGGEVMHSNPTHYLFFILWLENILRANLNFLISSGGLTDLKFLSELL